MNKKFKIISLILFFFIITLNYIPKNAFAVLLPANDDSTLLSSGQEHFYTVTLRGNSEAIVYAKIIFTNNTGSEIKTFSFETPEKISVNEIVSVQQSISNNCSSYDASGNCVTTNTNDIYNNGAYPNNDYNYQYNYNPNKNYDSYLKATISENGNKYVINLPNPVKPNQQNTIVIAYSTFDFVNEFIGLFKYEFTTLKVDDRVSNIRIAINTDSDLLLKGGRSGVDYNSRAYPLSAFSDVKNGAVINGEQMKSITQSLGYDGVINKQASNLSPNETYSTKGTYATSPLRLYLGSIISFILFIALIVASVFMIDKFIKRRKSIKTISQTVKDGEAISNLNSLQNQDNQQALNTPQPQTNVNTNNLPFFGMRNFLAGLISALCVIIISLSIEFIVKNVNHYSMSSIFIVIIFYVTILISYILAIFGPAIYMATKRGWKGFLSTLFFEFLLLALIGIFFGVFIFDLLEPIEPYYDQPFF